MPLSAGGTGKFVEVLLKQSMLPSPERYLPPTFQPNLDIFLAEDRPYFPSLIGLNQEVLLLAQQVDQLERDLSPAEVRRRLFGDPTRMIPESMYITSRRTRIQAFHQLMYDSQHIWRTQFPR
jgi:hypothetical protein